MSYVFDQEVESAVASAPVIDLTDIPALQAAVASAPSVPVFEPDAGVRLEVVATDGASPVELIVVRPDDEERRPLVLWFHGGGFVLGDARESLPFLDTAAREVGTVGVSVQYDLAPAARYPVPIDQGIVALEWLVANADRFGIDPDRIVLGGQSAGAAHATTLALRLRDTGGPRVMLQLLDIPVTDDRVATRSASDYVDTPVWTTENARRSWAAYLGGRSDAVVPARVDDLSGLPPAYITVGQYDPLRDEGIEYAQRLAHAGVLTELHLYPGTFHGSASIATDADVSRRHNGDLVEALRRTVARS